MTILFLSIKIFFARILDVSLGTIRTMFIVKGNKLTSASIAFIEVIIWFFAAREALNTELNSIWIAISYAGGYATGTFIGTFINEFFISGIYSIQVISSNITPKDINTIKNQDFGVSVISTTDHKTILLLSINKKRYRECLKLIKSIDSNSFIVVNEAKLAHNGYIKNKASISAEDVL